MSRVSFSAFAAVFILLSTSFAVGVAHELHQMSTNAASLAHARAKYLVLFVLDGATPQYMHLTPLPHLDALRKQGVEYDHAFAGILESETPSGHAALSTGSTPARDGLLGFNWIKQNTDAVRLFDPNVVRQGAIEHLMEQSGAPTIASLVKAKYPHAKVAAISGHKYYAADPLGGPRADFIMYYNGTPDGKFAPAFIPGHAPPASVFQSPGLIYPNTHPSPGTEDHLAVKLALTTFKQVHQQITLINLPEFDWPLGHVDGGETAKAIQLLKAFDHDLGQVEDAFNRAGILNQTAFVVTADHGMAHLNHLVPDSVLDDAVTKTGTSSLETTYSTGGYVWLQDRNMAQSVADNVVATKDPHVQSVYYKVTSKSGDNYVQAAGARVSEAMDAANQNLLTSFLGGNAPDVVAFCTEDAAFVSKGAESWKGNHGGGAWGSQHIPLILAGPSIASSKVSHSAARLEDVAPTALAAMGVSADAMQGIVLADALADPGTKRMSAQSVLNKSLAPVVAALSRQSTQDLRAR